MSGRWQGIAFAIAAVVVAIVTAWVGYWMGFAGQLPSDALLRADRHLSGILKAAALFTPLFVLYLTWRNWLTARHKIKVDLFDRRWGLWREVERIYSETIEGRDFTRPLQLSAIHASWQAQYLFSDAAGEYLRDSFFADLNAWSLEMNRSVEPEQEADWSKRVDELNDRLGTHPFRFHELVGQQMTIRE
ncbi:hypothetical protein IMCGPPIG_01945 [Stenotrophomonas maltophilia]|uniref:hypothetical protein n=1 Tax=Stenotrophomonas maltophilia TaxID=40324 RepID=UPI000621E68A|nr:hypothetical protein XY58_10010 [Stenotrophomonas maltophilia]MBA0255795.1 hypothetical protein [Stenotrophomonas maltophilia]MBA0452160.1 hypothetical protein [Stenotrophomonas maltophilia]MBA0480386.1 hypothetical protein [Stenotrophomonas maltophilia]MBA0489670.1 hypothetical protein [Stenotrophomonas maltophilia]